MRSYEIIRIGGENKHEREISMRERELSTQERATHETDLSMRRIAKHEGER